MIIDNLERKKIEAMVRDLLSVYVVLSETKLFFFGSRVDGSGSEHSDVDIGLISKHEISRETWAEITEQVLELPTHLTIQLVDFNKVSDSFKQVALAHIEYFGN